MSSPMYSEGLYYKIVAGERELLGEGYVELFVDSAGNHRYFLNGKLHREDGPALITANKEYAEWYIHGRQIHPAWPETRRPTDGN